MNIQRYSRQDIDDLLLNMVQIAKRQDTSEINEFIRVHNWPKKYLTVFPETDTMLRIANNSDCTIDQIEATEDEIRSWERFKLQPCISFHIWAPPPDDRNSLIIVFEMQDDGSFIYVNK